MAAVEALPPQGQLALGVVLGLAVPRVDGAEARQVTVLR